ncbi:hypothetical protein C8R44DRAFT_31419 [Mycena epipterygia]|nr:hypothetical protein C8R44DRAFT_31419 [Mycena epipterygia]
MAAPGLEVSIDGLLVFLTPLSSVWFHPVDANSHSLMDAILQNRRNAVTCVHRSDLLSAHFWWNGYSRRSPDSAPIPRDEDVLARMGRRHGPRSHRGC